MSLEELEQYSVTWDVNGEIEWKKVLGNDLNWALSFDHLREKDTTKHVHRLHPYKGKYIPQLVEYFIDEHIDDFKKEVFFKPGDIVLDPFLGSGTTVVQSLEMGIHSIGIDVSEFNCMISSCKIADYDHLYLSNSISKMLVTLDEFEKNNSVYEFENELLTELSSFNDKHFPGADFKYLLNHGAIQEEHFAGEREREFLPIYQELVKRYQIKLKQDASNTFLDKWFMDHVRQEIGHVFEYIKKEKDIKTRRMLALILSRTVRSCRATTHSDLATLKEPQLMTYYCYKHKKMCKPLFSIKTLLKRYAYDTINRVKTFDSLRKPACHAVIAGDSRTIDILEKVKEQDSEFGEKMEKQKISGVFCSPPYVGQIDYHEQHAYAYDLLGFERNDESEIGPLYKGKGAEARQTYVKGIVEVLNNCKRYFVDDYDVFLVANDKYNF